MARRIPITGSISLQSDLNAFFLAPGVALYQAVNASGGSCFATAESTAPSPPPSPPMRHPAGEKRGKKHCARTLNLEQIYSAGEKPHHDIVQGDCTT